MKIFKKTPNRHGGGSRTNLNGLSFEERTSLIESINQHPDIEIKNDYHIYYKGVKMGYYTEKHSFYSNFLSQHKIKWEEINSKKYLPDGVIVNEINKVVYIVEKKYQNGSGSVDEKLQTCDFKRRVYERLITGTGYETKYYYLLNDWYEQTQYNDVKEYIRNVGCDYFINFISFEYFGFD